MQKKIAVESGENISFHHSKKSTKKKDDELKDGKRETKSNF